MDEKPYSVGGWHALRAGGELLVVGAATYPTGGWTGALSVGNQGINPDPQVLYLRFTATEPTGAATDVITHQLVHNTFKEATASKVVINYVTVIQVTDLAG